jgi:hypothetical protein
MMFLNSLTDWFRKRIPADKTPQRPSARLRLEQLEDRLVPAGFGFTDTYTNASIQINPGFTVTETVTATVTPFPSFNFTPGSPGTAPNTPPSGATPPTGGNVIFNLNNMQQTVAVNSNGQATATFQVPLLSFLGSQTLGVQYRGFTDTNAGNQWGQSSFGAPIYKNFDNLLLPATITFNQLTPQQVYAFYFQEYSTNPLVPFQQVTANSPYNTANGETDNLGNGLIKFNYIDPGTINTITALGMQLPGTFAFQLGAYKGLGT